MIVVRSTDVDGVTGGGVPVECDLPTIRRADWYCVLWQLRKLRGLVSGQENTRLGAPIADTQKTIAAAEIRRIEFVQPAAQSLRVGLTRRK